MILKNIYYGQINNNSTKYKKNYIKNQNSINYKNKNQSMPSQRFFEINFTGFQSKIQKIQKEREEIYMLLNYSLINKNWQIFGKKNYRGYNICATLVDNKGKIIGSGLNSTWQDMNRTHHAEMNLIQNYLDKHPEQKGGLENFSIYTSLEPCAMCSGTILQTGIAKIMYGIDDPEYGGTIPRLTSYKFKKYQAYPIKTKNLTYQKAPDSISQKLREQYKEYADHSSKIVEWLNLKSVKNLFLEAHKKLDNFQTKYSENQDILTQTKFLLQTG